MLNVSEVSVAKKESDRNLRLRALEGIQAKYEEAIQMGMPCFVIDGANSLPPDLKKEILDAFSQYEIEEIEDEGQDTILIRWSDRDIVVRSR